MKIGAFGDIVFEVSDEVVRTFKEFQKSTPSRWAVHGVMGGYPKAEFIGPGQKSITLPVTLNALFLGGRTIEEEVDLLEEMADSGQVSTLVIAERICGKYYLDDVSQTTSHFGGKGEATVCEITLSLKHYAEDVALP